MVELDELEALLLEVDVAPTEVSEPTEPTLKSPIEIAKETSEDEGEDDTICTDDLMAELEGDVVTEDVVTVDDPTDDLMAELNDLPSNVVTSPKKKEPQFNTDEELEAVVENKDVDGNEKVVEIEVTEVVAEVVAEVIEAPKVEAFIEDFNEDEKERNVFKKGSTKEEDIEWELQKPITKEFIKAMTAIELQIKALQEEKKELKKEANTNSINVTNTLNAIKELVKEAKETSEDAKNMIRIKKFIQNDKSLYADILAKAEK